MCLDLGYTILAAALDQYLLLTAVPKNYLYIEFITKISFTSVHELKEAD
jgi:hypothetical protein